MATRLDDAIQSAWDDLYKNMLRGWSGDRSRRTLDRARAAHSRLSMLIEADYLATRPSDPQPYRKDLNKADKHARRKFQISLAETGSQLDELFELRRHDMAVKHGEPE